jgi:hypothetical protein
VPSLDDWEKEWQENPQRNVQPMLLPVNCRLLMIAGTQTN